MAEDKALKGISVAEVGTTGNIHLAKHADEEHGATMPTVEVRDRQEIATLLELDESSLDPAFTYRWALAKPQRIARLKAKGYTFVGPDEGIINFAGDDPDQGGGDGTIRVGDAVLMKIPKRNHRIRRHSLKKLTDERLTSAKKLFKRSAQQAGVEVRDESRTTTEME